MAVAVTVGYVGVSKSGTFTVVELLGGDKVKVRFEDGHEVCTTKGSVRRGVIWNPLLPSKYGKGFAGVGPHKQHGVKAHDYWAKMLQRVFCEDYKTAHPTYDEAAVCDDWLNYQNFAEWVTNQVGYGSMGYNLDKDLLVKGNKLYSPSTCVLLPQELNKLIKKKEAGSTNGLPIGVSTRPDLKDYVARLSKQGSGQGEIYLGLFPTPELAFAAYKKEKEEYIKERANYYVDTLSPRAYNALMQYQVDIND